MNVTGSVQDSDFLADHTDVTFSSGVTTLAGRNITNRISLL